MAKFSTPGQRRKRGIRIVLIILAIAATFISWHVEGPSQLLAKAAIADPHKEVIEATITDLTIIEEEYRNLKGKRRYRTDYFADLTYDRHGETIVDTQKISSSFYEQHEVGDKKEIWAFGPDQKMVRLKDNVLADARISPLERTIKMALISGITAYVLSLLLIPVFGREPDGYMPEGFYNDNSWLDVEDNQLIAIAEDHLIQYKFDSGKRSKVQAAYQRGDVAQAFGFADKKDKLVAIPVAAITKVESLHFEDTFTVKWNSAEADQKEDIDSASIEFLNPTVRNHALKQLSDVLGKNFDTIVTPKTRLQAAGGSMVCLVLFAAGFWYFEHILLLALFALLVAMAVKSLIARLWNPTVVTELSPVAAGQAA